MPRFEKWHNGQTMPTDWDGRGQPTAWKTTPPTEWTGLVYLDEGCKLKRFDSKEERDEWVSGFMQPDSSQYGHSGDS